MDKEMFEEFAKEHGLLKADGLDEAIIGIVHRACQEPVVAYDRAKCIDILAREMGEDAEEYFDYNVAYAWVGDKTPAFVEMLTESVEVKEDGE